METNGTSGPTKKTAARKTKKKRQRPSYEAGRAVFPKKTGKTPQTWQQRKTTQQTQHRRAVPLPLAQIVAGRTVKLAATRHRHARQRPLAAPVIVLHIPRLWLGAIKCFEPTRTAPANSEKIVSRYAKKITKRASKKATSEDKQAQKEAQWLDEADAREANRQAWHVVSDAPARPLPYVIAALAARPTRGPPLRVPPLSVSST